MPKITIERETLERAIDALGPVGGSNARNAYAELRAALKGEPDMSDVMLFGVLKMPYEMAMGHELSRRQYWQRAQEAAERLERAEAELARLREQEPVAWMVEGWHEGKLIARIPHLSLEKAKESAAVFSQHYTTTKIVLLYDAPPAPAAVPLTDGDELWLWRNGDHLLAFRHLYPCYSPGGDPMTLGEPVARAVFRSSHDRATKQEE